MGGIGDLTGGAGGIVVGEGIGGSAGETVSRVGTSETVVGTG